MADITNPNAVKWSNENIRTAANALAQLYYRARRVQDEWFALGMASEIPNTADTIIDGSATDGRPVITGADATNIITRIMEVVTDMEANDRAKLNTILKVAPNPGNNTAD